MPWFWIVSTALRYLSVRLSFLLGNFSTPLRVSNLMAERVNKLGEDSTSVSLALPVRHGNESPVSNSFELQNLSPLEAINPNCMNSGLGIVSVY